MQAPTQCSHGHDTSPVQSGRRRATERRTSLRCSWALPLSCCRCPSCVPVRDERGGRSSKGAGGRGPPTAVIIGFHAERWSSRCLQKRLRSRLLAFPTPDHSPSCLSAMGGGTQVCHPQLQSEQRLPHDVPQETVSLSCPHLFHLALFWCWLRAVAEALSSKRIPFLTWSSKR